MWKTLDRYGTQLIDMEQARAYLNRYGTQMENRTCLLGNTAKRTSNRVVHHAKSEAETVALQKIDARSGDVYRLAKQMCFHNQDVMGEKPVKNDAGQLSLDEESKKEAWKEHYERLLNVEFPWNPEDLSEESPVEGSSEPITLEMITKAITIMASGKAAGPSGIVAEMLKPVWEAGAEEVRDLVENIISEDHSN